MKLTFDDVLIKPKFNTISSRKDVDISTNILNIDLKIPVISSNMDTITEGKMVREMTRLGAGACLHRFMDKTTMQTMVWGMPLTNMIASVGVSDYEFQKAKALYGMGVRRFCIDVAHGASLVVCQMLDKMHYEFKDDDVFIMIGNFATGASLFEFVQNTEFMPDAVKVGIGPGSACTTRVKTGCGFPQLSAISDVAQMAKTMDIKVVADGGMRTPGDISKALAVGADAVMLGGMLAATYESPNVQRAIRTRDLTFTSDKSIMYKDGDRDVKNWKITYRGSASKESYEDQGKDESWRTAEGESFQVPYKGPVEPIIKDIEGGLRSAFTYVGAKNLKEFQEFAEFIEISSATRMENGAHGKGS